MLALMNVCHAGFVGVAVREMAVSVGLHRGSKQQEGWPQQIGYQPCPGSQTAAGFFAGQSY